MNINVFIREYKMHQGDNKLTYLEKHVKNVYTPYLEKVTLCSNLAKITTHRTIEKENKTEFYVNSCNRYILFVMRILSIYTDLDINFANSKETSDAYDSLCREGLIPIFMEQLINPIEINEFKLILDMCINDIYENERSIVSYIDSQFEALRRTAISSAAVIKNVVDENPELKSTFNNAMSEFKDKITDFREI